MPKYKTTAENLILEEFVSKQRNQKLYQLLKLYYANVINLGHSKQSLKNEIVSRFKKPPKSIGIAVLKQFFTSISVKPKKFKIIFAIEKNIWILLGM